MFKRYVGPVPLSPLWYFTAHHLATALLLSMLNACRNTYSMFVFEFVRVRRLCWVNVWMCKCVCVCELAWMQWGRNVRCMCVCVCGMQSRSDACFSFWLRISAFRGIPSAVPPCRSPEDMLQTHTHTPTENHTITVCSYGKRTHTSGCINSNIQTLTPRHIYSHIFQSLFGPDTKKHKKG